MGGLVVILYLKELRHITDYISEGIRTYRARQAERRAERERIREAEEAERREREAQEEAIRAAEAARIAEEERIEAEKRRCNAYKTSKTQQPHCIHKRPSNHFMAWQRLSPNRPWQRLSQSLRKQRKPFL